MRPAWLKCETCLFEGPDGGADNLLCYKNPLRVKVYKDSFCGAWTCRRCLQPWRYGQIEYFSPERQWGWEYYGVNNHYECKEAGEHPDGPK